MEEQEKDDIFSQIELLQEEISKLQFRDVTAEKQAWKIDELTATIAENDRIVHYLEERNRLLIIENERYKTELNKQQDKIIRFNL